MPSPSNGCVLSVDERYFSSSVSICCGDSPTMSVFGRSPHTPPRLPRESAAFLPRVKPLCGVLNVRSTQLLS